MTTRSKPTVSLVLGGGGAKGLTHIGVIRCLEERGYDIRYIAGSSIGALIGGVYAAGKLDTYADWVSALERVDIVRLLDWSFDGGALFKGEKIISVLKTLVGEYEIEALPIGYTAVATDLSSEGSGREVWLNKGPLFDAIRASIAVPMVFAPVQRDGQLLVDGSVVNPVPVAPTLNNRTDITIAVDLNARPNAGLRALRKESPPPDPSHGAYHRSIRAFLDRLLGDAPSSNTGIGVSDVMMRSMETMQASITQFKLASNAPTLLIGIPKNLCSFFDFHRAQDLIAYGHRSAQRALARFEGESESSGDT